MSGHTVGETLDRVLGTEPRPRSITVDHGTEFQSRALEDWAYRRGVRCLFYAGSNFLGDSWVKPGRQRIPF
jgi:putative transposase